MLCTPSIVPWFVVVGLRLGVGTRYQFFSRPLHSPSGVAACPRSRMLSTARLTRPDVGQQHTESIPGPQT